MNSFYIKSLDFMAGKNLETCLLNNNLFDRGFFKHSFIHSASMCYTKVAAPHQWNIVINKKCLNPIFTMLTF